jgi:hypothetical protein
VALHRAPRFPAGACEGDRRRVITALGRSSPFVAVIADDGPERRAPWIAHRDFHVDEAFGNIADRPCLEDHEGK